MLLAKIVGTVVATRKDERLHGYKLLIARLVDEKGDEQKGHVIAVDTVGAGYREIVLVVQGSGFNWPHPDHLRIVTLPRADDLTDAIQRIGTFLADYRGDH